MRALLDGRVGGGCIFLKSSLFERSELDDEKIYTHPNSCLCV